MASSSTTQSSIPFVLRLRVRNHNDPKAAAKIKTTAPAMETARTKILNFFLGCRVEWNDHESMVCASMLPPVAAEKPISSFSGSIVLQRLGIDLLSRFASDGDPWEHALGMSIGVVFANQMVKWEKKLKEDLDKIVEKA
ncbi:uncharacterized protein LOC121970886 [Zingiber officinale]|uniref:Uncharacterized protein n=1 Tax=Zingiber officinale TaxID=94328 RepID=A0A8J5GVG0_ZINOF|nr:uncharacterized protein LOC121970886 [Zingiber officinale]KAG6515333.1 hypothetical protein ZIOFF_025726 [Zingiber officinale]